MKPVLITLLTFGVAAASYYAGFRHGDTAARLFFTPLLESSLHDALKHSQAEGDYFNAMIECERARSIPKSGTVEFYRQFEPDYEAAR